LGNGKGFFTDVSRTAGDYFHKLHSGRGAAMADYDNDGRMDLAINHCGEPATLLHNETPTAYHFIRLQLEGSRHTNPKGANRDAIGARVAVKAGGRTIVRHVKGGGSYLSSHDRRLLIGLGESTRVDDVEVRWPNAAASTEHFGSLEADRSYKLVEGTGKAADARCPRVKLAAEGPHD
jgi:hypothetical protein